MVCKNPKCGGEARGKHSYCSRACFLSLGRGFREPLPVQGARWVELGGKRFSLVDERIYEAVVASGLWSKTRLSNRKIGAHRYESGREVKLHAFVMRRILGAIPAGYVIDHKNGDSLDNRACNLRLATLSENNTAARIRAPRSGFRGVHTTSQGHHVVRLSVRGRRVHIGSFQTPEEAARAYDDAARPANRSFALLNFPTAGEESAVPRFVQIDEVLIRPELS